MKIRCIYHKLNNLKFISHLDTVDLIQRAIFNTNVKIQFSEGFNPHPKMSFGNPLPLGVSSSHELFDLYTEEDVNLEEFKDKINEYLPRDVQVTEIFVADSTGISEMYNYAKYNFQFIYTGEIANSEIELGDEFLILRKVKQKKNKKSDSPQFKEENIISHIKSLDKIVKISDNLYTIDALLENSYSKIINPNNFIEGLFKLLALDIKKDEVEIHKKEMIKI